HEHSRLQAFQLRAAGDTANQRRQALPGRVGAEEGHHLGAQAGIGFLAREESGHLGRIQRRRLFEQFLQLLPTVHVASTPPERRGGSMTRRGLPGPAPCRAFETIRRREASPADISTASPVHRAGIHPEEKKVLLPTEGREAHGRPGRIVVLEATKRGRPWPKWIVCSSWVAGRVVAYGI